MNILYVPLAAGVGAIVAGILGWLESNEPWSTQKYLPTIIRAAVAAIGAAIVTPVVGQVGWVVIIGAALAGAGFDVVGHRVAGIKK